MQRSHYHLENLFARNTYSSVLSSLAGRKPIFSLQTMKRHLEILCIISVVSIWLYPSLRNRIRELLGVRNKIFTVTLHSETNQVFNILPINSQSRRHSNENYFGGILSYDSLYLQPLAQFLSHYRQLVHVELLSE